jgi:putative transposase
MRYPAAEKLEIIQLVEQSPLPMRRTLAKLGIVRAIFTAGTIGTAVAGRRL